MIESVGVIKCELDDIEYPLGIDSVRLARHSSIQHCVEAYSRIQHQPYVTMGMPLYEYKFGSVEAGILMLKNDTNIKQNNVKKWIPAEKANTQWLPSKKANTEWLPGDKASTQWLPREKANTEWLPREKANTEWFPREKANTPR